mgnify:CR=1 FL=1
MKKQKVCIVGDGLTGLITALSLSRLNIDIHLIGKKHQIHKSSDNRTTALSPSNYSFLSKYFDKTDLKSFWPCKKIRLYNETSNNNSNFMNLENHGNNIMYIIENKKLKEIILNKIKKEKKIKIINEEIKKIDEKKSCIYIKNRKSFYDLILLCLGKKSNIIPKLIGARVIKENSDQIAFTAIVQHNSNIIEPEQYFLREGPLAILPLNPNRFSFVWSINKKNKTETIDSLIRLRLNKILDPDVKINIGKIVSFPISFRFNTNFFKKNILVLGDGLYNNYPLAGQGFNLIMRDIIKLFEDVKNNISLGIQIKDSLILDNFMNSRKPENLLFSLGVTFTHHFFKQNKNVAPLKNLILKDINKFKFLKDLSLRISNKGIF